MRRRVVLAKATRHCSTEQAVCLGGFSRCLELGAAARRTFVARCSRWPSDHPTHRRVSCEIADEHLLLIKSQLGDIHIFDTHDHLTQAHCIVARIPPSMFLVVDGSANVCGRQY